jgi:hypothetical protein
MFKHLVGQHTQQCRPVSREGNLALQIRTAAPVQIAKADLPSLIHNIFRIALILMPVLWELLVDHDIQTRRPS